MKWISWRRKATLLARPAPVKPTDYYPSGNIGQGQAEANRDANESVTYTNYTWSAAE
jgi:hypothetical protein